MGVGGTPPFHKEKICYNSNLDWFVCVKKLIWLVLFGVTSQDSHLKLVCLHVCVKLLLEMIRQEQILHQDEPLAVSLQVPCLHRAEGGEEWSWGRWKTPKLQSCLWQKCPTGWAGAPVAATIFKRSKIARWNLTSATSATPGAVFIKNDKTGRWIFFSTTKAPV